VQCPIWLFFVVPSVRAFPVRCSGIFLLFLLLIIITNSHNLYSTITEKLQKYTDLKDELTRIWEMNAVYMIPLVLSKMGISQQQRKKYTAV
jgi:hypothetical protein